MMLNRSHILTVVLLAALLALSACGDSGTPEQAASPTVAVAAGAEPTSPPTAAPSPTAPPIPRPTAAPARPTPTVQPQPTAVLNGAANADEASLTQGSAEMTTVEVVKILRPSVVHIAITTPDSDQGMGDLTQPIPQGVGTGVVLDTFGHILTNNHVVEGASKITVTLNTGESFTATVVGGDPQTDTAVVLIEATGLQPAMLGDSDALEVGEDVIAIGHALDLPGGPSVSKGVVSALGRAIVSDPQFQITIVDLIQTDASINPGNSGGPLVNSRAEVVGINTAIIPQSQGIGFSININDATLVATQLIENGFVRRGFLGITPVNVTPGRAVQFELAVTEGILLARVLEGFPADAAGLRAGDVIVQLGGEPIANTGELSAFLMNHPPGESVEVVFLRGELERRTDVILGERPRE